MKGREVEVTNFIWECDVT